MNKKQRTSNSKEKQDVEMWKKLQHPPLSLFLHIREGIQTGGSDLFLIKEEEKSQVENESLRPLVQAEDIDPFQYVWNKRWIIYTNQSNFYERFQKAIEYLKKNKIALKRRSAVWMFDKKWWELEDPLEEQVFKKMKIISPLISNKNSFTLDTNGYFCQNDCIIAYPRQVEKLKESMQNFSLSGKEEQQFNALIAAKEELLLYILGLLNSAVSEYFLKNKIVRKSFRRKGNGKFYWYKPKYVRRVPIPIPSEAEKENICRLVKDLLKLGQHLSSSTRNKRGKRAKFNHVKTKLDEKIFDIFNLDEKERAKVQVFLSGT